MKKKNDVTLTEITCFSFQLFTGPGVPVVSKQNNPAGGKTQGSQSEMNCHRNQSAARSIIESSHLQKKKNKKKNKITWLLAQSVSSHVCNTSISRHCWDYVCLQPCASHNSVKTDINLGFGFTLKDSSSGILHYFLTFLRSNNGENNCQYRSLIFTDKAKKTYSSRFFVDLHIKSAKQTK